MWCNQRVIYPKDADGMAIGVEPDQIAPSGAIVWTGSTMFAQIFLSENLESLRRIRRSTCPYHQKCSSSEKIKLGNKYDLLDTPHMLKYKQIYWSKYLQSVEWSWINFFEWSKYLHYQPLFTRSPCRRCDLSFGSAEKGDWKSGMPRIGGWDAETHVKIDWKRFPRFFR